MVARTLVILALLAVSPQATAGDDPTGMTRDTLRRQATLALQRIKAERAPTLRATWSKHRVTPRLVTGLAEITQGKTLVDRARGFVQANQEWLRAPLASLTTEGTSTSRTRRVVRFAQTIDGLSVVGRTLTVTMDPQGRVLRVQNDLEQVRRFAAGQLPKAQAVAAAKNVLFGDDLRGWAKATSGKVRKVWVVTRGNAHQAWEVWVAVGLMQQRVVLVSTVDGRVFGIRNPILGN